jgi:hypothetical protein
VGGALGRPVRGGLPMMNLLHCEQMRCTALGEGTRVTTLHTGRVLPRVSSPSVFTLPLLECPWGGARQWIFQIIHDAEVLTQARSVSTILVEQTPRVYKADIQIETGFSGSTQTMLYPQN